MKASSRGRQRHPKLIRQPCRPLKATMFRRTEGKGDKGVTRSSTDPTFRHKHTFSVPAGRATAAEINQHLFERGFVAHQFRTSMNTSHAGTCSVTLTCERTPDYKSARDAIFRYLSSSKLLRMADEGHTTSSPSYLPLLSPPMTKQPTGFRPRCQSQLVRSTIPPSISASDAPPRLPTSRRYRGNCAQPSSPARKGGECR